MELEVRGIMGQRQIKEKQYNPVTELTQVSETEPTTRNSEPSIPESREPEPRNRTPRTRTPK